MKRVFLIIAALAVVAVCGCIESMNGGTSGPTLAPLPTAEPLPTAAPLPTAEPLPTMPPSPTITPIPASSSDPIIGTWSFVYAAGNLTSYYFKPDGTFERHDSDKGTAYTGVWERKGDETYTLIYDQPGHTTETVTYSPRGTRMARNDTYFTRV